MELGSMRIYELIEELKQLPQHLEVVIDDGDNGINPDVSGVSIDAGGFVAVIHS